MPGGGLAGISGVESGKAAPLVGGPPGVELHTTVEGLPSGDSDTVPVVLPTTSVGMVPNAVPDIIVVGGIIAVLPATEGETMAGTVDGVGAEVAVEADRGVIDPIADDALGIVESAKSVRNDVAGVADSKRGAVELAVVEVGEVAGTVGIVGAGDAALDKPDPAPVTLALHRSGVEAGEAVWFVGDTGVDMECAYNSGCIPVLLGDGATEEELLRCAPRLVFAEPASLFHFVRGL